MKSTVKPKRLSGDAMKIARGQMRAPHLAALQAQWELDEAGDAKQLELLAEPDDVEREAAAELARDIRELVTTGNEIPF